MSVKDIQLRTFLKLYGQIESKNIDIDVKIYILIHSI